METENNNNQPEPSHPRTESSTIYPTPIDYKNNLVSTSGATPSLNINPYRIPWHKIALLGFFTQLVLGLLWGLVLNASFGVLLSIAVVFRGVENLLIIFYLGAIPVTYSRLKRWTLDFPFIIASASIIFLYGAYRFGQKLPSTTSLDAFLSGYEQTTTDRLSPLIGLFTFLLAGTLIFLLATYLTNKFRYKPIGITILLIVIIGINVGASVYQKPTSLFDSLPRVKDVSWKLLPTYLPAGVEDVVDSSKSACPDERTKSAWYECEYSFVNYPGYLSQSSQEIINKALSKERNPSPDFHYEPGSWRVTVIRDDKLLDVYKYKDEKCDIFRLKDSGTSPRTRDGRVVSQPPAKLQRCVKVTTPGGKSLYYDSYLNYSKDDIEKVPVDFYFEQSDNIVIIRVGDNKPLAGRVTSLYYIDPNFQPEFYKFVDSFQ